MKIFAYNYREFDEAEYFQRFAKEFGIDLGICVDSPTLENIDLAAGYEYVSLFTTKIDEPLIRRFREIGVKKISTRSIGYDHVDIEAARKHGLHVSNVSYKPECVADYTVMLMLMSLRKMKRIMQREEINDFSLSGLQGKELPNMTVGVLGTGKIGRSVIRDLSGFGCRIYAYDKYEDDEVKQYAEYSDLGTIYEECDLITLHMPLGEKNYHMLNKEAFDKMKKGVVVINTARGGLIDTKALIDALESEKVGAAALDVVEDEYGMYYCDLKTDVISKRDLYILRGFPNVIVTPHMAFYTDQTVSDMVKHSLESCILWEQGKNDPWAVV